MESGIRNTLPRGTYSVKPTGTVGGLGVTEMLALALTASQTLSLESPNKADILVGVLGNGDILSFHHVGDVSEFGFPEVL
jgi:hypothetical protein